LDIEIKIDYKSELIQNATHLKSNNKEAFLSIDKDDVANRGIASSIDDIVKERQCKICWFLSASAPPFLQF
jgi:hypothetical protein